MRIRIARHTTDLNKMIDFYTIIPDVEILGSFKDHSDYDGVFLGIKNHGWHMEFTVDKNVPDHRPDDDDLLVFYFTTNEERETVRKKFNEKGYRENIPKNPYWKENGILFKDPDGFGIILALNN